MAATLSQKFQQNHILYTNLLDQVNPKHPLMVMARKIPWVDIETQLLSFYSVNGRPSKPVRLMVGLIILKQMYNLSDDQVVNAWIENPYFQAFCGETVFQWKMPCEPSDLTHFRNRIGKDGIELLFKMSIKLHGDKSNENMLIADTTVQEKNVTFPTDTKLCEKVIVKCRKIAIKEKIKLKRSYGREVSNLQRTVRFHKSNNPEKVDAARNRLNKIADTLVDELKRKLPKNAKDKYDDVLKIYDHAINQKKDDKNKVYSIHEPQVVCIAKGKEHKKYEYGSKVALAVTFNSCIIVATPIYSDNIYDGHTLSDLISQSTKMTGKIPKTIVCDRGFRGEKTIGNTDILIPGAPLKENSDYQKRQAKKNFGRRSAIEPVIGHLKRDFRMARNFLKGSKGDVINALLAATAFNLRKFMREIAARLFGIFFSFYYIWTKICKKDIKNALGERKYSLPYMVYP